MIVVWALVGVLWIFGTLLTYQVVLRSTALWLATFTDLVVIEDFGGDPDLAALDFLGATLMLVPVIWPVMLFIEVIDSDGCLTLRATPKFPNLKDLP